MITTEKILIFKKYNGDIDHFARVGSSRDKSVLTDVEWSEIDNLIQDLELSKKGLTSLEFNKKLDLKISKLIDSKETLEQIEGLIKK